MQLQRIFIIGFVFLFHYFSSQEQKYPFGVSAPIYWIEAKKEGNNIVLEEKISKSVLTQQDFSKGKLLNENLSFPFNGNTEKIQFEMAPEAAEHYSIFIVYEPNHHQNEQNLWSLELKNHQYKDETLISATNHRLVDFTGGQYRSYPEKLTQERVKIHYYQHHKNLKKEPEQKGKNFEKYILNLGGKSLGLPPLAFLGHIAEVLVYDRVLSNKEMQQVASYLSIKYGVSLHQYHFKNYYDGIGQRIWDYEKHQSFNQNITALGKHLKGQLYQHKSYNSNDKQVVAMAMKARDNREIPDNYFVFWSDNGKALTVQKQQEGRPKGISRVWNLDVASHQEAKLDWGFSPKNIDFIEENHQKNEQYFWMVIDSTGKGDFSPHHTQYIKLNKIIENRPSEISDLGQYLPSHSSSVVYSIWQAPEMFAHLEVKNGKCQRDELGGFTFNMVGGTAPYDIRVRHLGGKIADQVWQEQNNKGKRSIALPSGKYLYEIKDSKNRSYTQEVYLTNTDAPLPKFQEEYILGKDALVLDASKTLPKGNYSYEWHHNGKLVSQNPTYWVQELGNYELYIKSDTSCHSATRFMVSEGLKDKNPEAILYPNPSTGAFKLMAQFPKTTSGTLQIYDSAGRLLEQKEFYNLSQYEYDGYIGVSGMYIIHLKTTLSENSYKLLITH